MKTQVFKLPEQSVRETGRGWLRRIVGWWRRITGRTRRYVGIDPAGHESDKSAWCIMEHDRKTGVYTVIQTGYGEPPANDRTLRPAK